MLVITICYIIGILWGLYLEINIVPFVIITVISIAFINGKKVSESMEFLNSKLVNKIRKNIKYIIFCLIIIVVSSSIVKYKENKFENLFLDITDIKCIAQIVDVQEESDYYYNYIIKIKSSDNNFKNTKLLLKVKKDEECEPLKNGDLIKVLGIYERPSVRRNYKGFDYSQYLKTKDIYGIYKTEMNNISLIEKNTLSVYKMWITNLRNILKNNILKLLSDDSEGVAIALLLGDTTFISENEKQVFSDANLSHILAISGMHVSYVIAGGTFILKKCDTRKKLYILMLFLIFFATLTGGSSSVIRAVIMGNIAILAKLVYRKSDTLNNIAISSFLILIFRPYAILELGFQLSFLGTLGIVLFNKKVEILMKKYILIEKYKFIEKICNIILISISANIFIFPILVYNFNSISFVFLISNILVTPLLGIMSLMGYITIISSLFSLKLACLFSYILEILIRIFNYIAEISSKIEILKFQVGTPNIFLILLIYIIIFVLLNVRKESKKKIIKNIILVIVIITVVFNLWLSFNKQLKIFFIDVGQGDSSLIITPKNKVILIDGGGSETGSYNVGEKILLPYLLDRNIKKIDYIIISHFDTDHVGRCIICNGKFKSRKCNYFKATRKFRKF